MTHHPSDSPTPPARPPYAAQPRAALIASACIGAYLLLQQLVVGVQLVGQPASGGWFALWLLWEVLPMLLGVFLLLALFPVGRRDPLVMVLVKAVLATVAGVLLTAAAGFVSAMASSGLWAFGDLKYLSTAPVDLLSSTLASTPLVALVVVIQWLILRTPRP